MAVRWEIEFLGPMTRDEMVRTIDDAMAVLRRELARFPSDLALRNVERALDKLRSEVLKQWPLPAEFTKDLELGLYAVRNFDPDFPELVTRLIQVEQAALGP